MKTFDIATYVASEDLLRARVVLITGAGDGIGRAVARAAAGCGATVVLLGRTTSKLESVYDEILAAGSPRPAILPFDLTADNAPDYVAIADKIAEEYGRLDGLVHNAGVLGKLAPIEHYDTDLWSTVLHVNLTAVFLLTRACLPLLRQSGDASLLFTSSGVGRKGRAYWGAYAASKFATEGLMQILAQETEDAGKIRANTINPGATRTAMRALAYPAEDRDKLARPEDIVQPYLFLLGPHSKGITGHSFDAQS